MTDESHADARVLRAKLHEDARVLRARLHAVRPRTLEDAGLGAAPMRTFKADARSHVWLVDAVEGRRVIKRFVYCPLRQRLALLLGIHPGRRELACNRLLGAARVRVVPIVDAGVEGRGLFWFKDFKPSNIVIDEAGEAWLIDVGSARPAQKPSDTKRMLAVMDRVLARAGADAALRRRFGDSVRQAGSHEDTRVLRAGGHTGAAPQREDGPAASPTS